MSSTISVKDLKLSFGAVDVLKNLNLHVEGGEFIVLLGSSGCGKSTLLNCIAGLLEPTDGQIFFDDENVTWKEPAERGIGMVFQSYALYPQMTVRKNLTFGLRKLKLSAQETEARLTRVAALLHIENLLDRKPAALSGGQRQRVAIGRALAREARIFLFDEPLSNLDAKLRSELRVELKRLHAQLGNTMVYVTHDQIEALTMADRIAVMRGGVIQQFDTPARIYNKPSNLYVAGFVGSPSMNILEAKLVLDGGQAQLNFGSQQLTLDVTGIPTSSNHAALFFGVRPEHVCVSSTPQDGTLSATVDIDEPMGSESLLWLNLDEHKIAAKVNSDHGYVTGETVTVSFNTSKSSLFDKASEKRLEWLA